MSNNSDLETVTMELIESDKLTKNSNVYPASILDNNKELHSIITPVITKHNIEKLFILNKDSVKDIEDIKNILDFIIKTLNIRSGDGTTLYGLSEIIQYLKQ